ncbi:MAG: cellulase family glycosylhydrolase [Candidatus Kapabacteria bacterium]|nr:cellulase family glycosylhydrolase [Candidatus Kapabacteria bacterium]
MKTTLAFLLVLLSTGALAQVYPGLRVVGRHLVSPCNDTVMIRGVNKMVVWTGDLDLRKKSYAEIKKTGANCIRIVWLAQPGQFEFDATPEGLDRNIQDAIDAGLIPMVELHDATGDWSKLSMVVDYWTRPDVVAVVKKHERYMLLNIANEAGDETVTDQQFIAGYTTAIQRIRATGIKTPLIIDGADWGKNLEQLVRTAPTITMMDEMRNIMYSVHTYWAVSDGANAAFIAQQFTSAVESGLPFIVGEFTNLFNRNGGCTYETAYQGILATCAQYKIGWLAWEWGPGNEFADPTCDVMNMTTNSYYETLKDGWAKTVAETSPHSIKETSVSSYFVMHKGACDPVSVQDQGVQFEVAVVSPNPSAGAINATYTMGNAGTVRIEIINSVGALITTFTQHHGQPGTYTVPIKVDMSGMYYSRITLPSHTIVMPFVIVR